MRTVDASQRAGEPIWRPAASTDETPGKPRNEQRTAPVFVKMIGVGLVIAIALDATIVRALLVPGTMRLLGRVNWWAHMLVILAFLALIPASKHFHLVVSPITVLLKSPELGRVERLVADGFGHEALGHDRKILKPR